MTGGARGLKGFAVDWSGMAALSGLPGHGLGATKGFTVALLPSKGRSACGGGAGPFSTTALDDE